MHHRSAPALQDLIPVEALSEPAVEMLDESFGGRNEVDAPVTAKLLRDRRRVLGSVGTEFFDIDPRSDNQRGLVLVNSRLNQDPGDLSASDEHIIRPLEPRIDAVGLTEERRHDDSDLERQETEVACFPGVHRRGVDALVFRRVPGSGCSSLPFGLFPGEDRHRRKRQLVLDTLIGDLPRDRVGRGDRADRSYRLDRFQPGGQGAGVEIHAGSPARF